MNKPICIKCETELKWGGFVYTQNTCFDCFIKEVKSIIKQTESSEDKDILNWMLDVMSRVDIEEIF
ncbi:hypothetical protein FACS1894132_04910 [Clostridia bacterium]|nr:hypothetical protein FACS1894132_04910 [Clostridia bacterium]